MADSADWAAEVDSQERELSNRVKGIGISDAKTTSTPTTSAPTVTSAPAVASVEDDDWNESPTVTADGDDQDKPLDAAEASYLTKVLRTKLVDSQVLGIEVQRRDPNSPLYSVKSFEELRLQKQLLDGVYAMGFNKPSKIQETALPVLMAHPPSNMIAQSQSGTGKTAAFVLAALSRVNPENKWPQVLILAPTYELACQIGDVISKMAKFMISVKLTFAIRGEKVARGSTIQEHLIIGTPGTVQDWMFRKRAFDPKKIDVFVLDEADIMINTQGFQDQSIRVRRALRDDCQVMLFSATYSDDVMSFARRVVAEPVIIRLKKEEETVENIKQYYVQCRNEDDKFQALSNIYGVVTIGQAMVFCRTKKSAAWLAQKMTSDGHAVGLLTGDITVEQRIAVLNRFREGKEKLLVTTNVCARGIDVEQVTVVVNYDVPLDTEMKPDYETYLHRIGRTGRFGKSGLAINFVDGRRSHENLMKIEEHFGKKILKLSTDDVEEMEKLNQ
ncbi:ATP-dependent RNA helicase DDX19A-like isoform X2 [Corticium candelabrum]|uniref:ATP-dependent RNA helicase DDX19A-like isoform X2 n=1 Tax=Corticium candelabrum TaxID=121492 RepID=UPI002E26DBF8|nr:ATP-dependent RNA helicase DDX19A-like isoform X2 [Corticium candelabrum]